MHNHTPITFPDAQLLLHSPKPHALLDVREAGEFAAGHALVAANVPLSRLEMLADSVVPSRAVPIILMDEGPGDDRAERAAAVLSGMGYADLMILEGGARLWEQQGGALVSGLFCFPKGFAEVMEHARRTPLISPEDLMTRIAQGEKTVVVDVRDPSECGAGTLKGAVVAPGCEAVCRLADIAPDPQTTVVVTCAARARGVIWAQALIDSGVPNPVFALLGGTMNWEKAGGLLVKGAAQTVGAPSDGARKAAAASAAALTRAFAFSFVSLDELAEWQQSDFPLYVYDIRPKEEFAARRLKESHSAPGAELVLRVEQCAAMRRARMVLVDEDGARAAVVASVLLQMGLMNVHILEGGLAAAPENRVTGETPPPPPEAAFDGTLATKELEAELAGGNPPLVIDVGASGRYLAEHIPSSLWAPRAFLGNVRRARADARTIVLVSDDEKHARFAAQDAAKLWPGASIRCLKGGFPAWETSGLPLETGAEGALCALIDALPQPGNNPEAKAKAMEAYFDWDNTLAAAIRADGSAAFAWPGEQTRP